MSLDIFKEILASDRMVTVYVRVHSYIYKFGLLNCINNVM